MILEYVAAEQAQDLKESADQAFKAKNYRKAVDVWNLSMPFLDVVTSFGHLTAIHESFGGTEIPNLCRTSETHYPRKSGANVYLLWRYSYRPSGCQSGTLVAVHYSLELPKRRHYEVSFSQSQAPLYVCEA
jgi:hypothetical protein